jgi:hypothetical protein
MSDQLGKKENTIVSWEDTSTLREEIAEWQQSAFHAALEKLQTEHGTPDTVMRMGEAFGRGLYAERIKEKPSEWTMKEWIDEIQKDVCAPLGTEFTFTKISPDLATTFVNRNPLMKKLKDDHQPEFIFKTHASAKDKLERERTIRTFTILNKEDGA